MLFGRNPSVERTVKCAVAIMMLVEMRRGKKVLSVCRQGAVMNCMSHFLQAVWILSAFLTPHTAKLLVGWQTVVNLFGVFFFSPPGSEFASPSTVHSSLLLWGSELCWFLGDVQLVLRS